MMSLFSKLVVIGSCLVIASSAYALQVPTSSSLDHRIQKTVFNDQNVTRINAANGFISTIIFAPGEKVINYGSGYSTAWEFATSDNQFFLKPKDKDGTTNLVVVTNKRIYNFDIFLVQNSNLATYKLTFSYPNEKKALDAQKLKEDELNAALKAPDPNINTNPHLKNCYYTMNFGDSLGSRHIAPLLAFDDGLFTYFKFKPNTDFPVIYSVSSDGESLVNSHIEDNTLIVHGVYAEYRFRAGSDVVGVYNDNFEKGLAHSSTKYDQTITAKSTVKDISRSINE